MGLTAGHFASSNPAAGSVLHGPGSAKSPGFTASILSRGPLRGFRLTSRSRSLPREDNFGVHVSRARECFLEIFASAGKRTRENGSLHGIEEGLRRPDSKHRENSVSCRRGSPERNLQGPARKTGEIDWASGVVEKTPGSVEPHMLAPQARRVR